jgi:hypothetical protein
VIFSPTGTPRALVATATVNRSHGSAVGAATDGAADVVATTSVLGTVPAGPAATLVVGSAAAIAGVDDGTFVFADVLASPPPQPAVRPISSTDEQARATHFVV